MIFPIWLLNLARKLKISLLRTYKYIVDNLVWYFLDQKSRKKNDGTKYQKLAVLVHSFDGYKRFWKPAVFFTQRAFPVETSIYYASEILPMSSQIENCILTGKGNFVERLAIALESISKYYKYVFYLQEDIWVDPPISPSDLNYFIEIMEAEALDCLKLGKFSFAQEDKVDIFNATDPITDEFRWFGNFPYAVSHHCSIFRVDFFLNTAKLALLAGVKNPEHETFVSQFFLGKIKSKRKEFNKNIKIAVWSNQPKVNYAHASYVGRLTPEGMELLKKYGIETYYDETLTGEIFPPDRSYDHVSSKNLDRS